MPQSTDSKWIWNLFPFHAAENLVYQTHDTIKAKWRDGPELCIYNKNQDPSFFFLDAKQSRAWNLEPMCIRCLGQQDSKWRFSRREVLIWNWKMVWDMCFWLGHLLHSLNTWASAANKELQAPAAADGPVHSASGNPDAIWVTPLPLSFLCASCLCKGCNPVPSFHPFLLDIHEKDQVPRVTHDSRHNQTLSALVPFEKQIKYS